MDFDGFGDDIEQSGLTGTVVATKNSDLFKIHFFQAKGCHNAIRIRGASKSYYVIPFGLSTGEGDTV